MKSSKFLLFLTILLAPLYVVRFNIGPYSSTLLEVLVGLTVGAWVVEKVQKEGLKGLKGLKGINVPTALFLTAAVISVLVSPDKRGALGIFKAYFVEPLLIYLVIKDTVKTKKDWRLVFLSLTLSGLWVALLAVFQGLTGQLQGRAHAVYNTANAVGLYIGPIVMLLLGVLLSAKEKFKVQSSKFKVTVQNLKLKWAIPFAILSMILAIIFSKSEGAMIGLVTALLVPIAYCLLPKKWVVRMAGLTGVVLAIGGILFFFNVSSFTPKDVDPYVRESTNTLQFRLCLWEGARNLLLDRPIFGAGLSGFKELYSQKYFTCDAEPLEYPHNWVLNFLVETGVLGLLGFLGILGRYFEKVKRVERVKREMGVVFAAAMIYWLVHGLVDVPYFKNDLSLEFWVLVGLAETLGFTLRLF